MKIKRVFYAAIGVVVMLFAGFIYAWSILAGYIASDYPGWSSGSLSLTFTLCMGFFCLGSLAAGMLSKRFSVRLNMYISAILFFAGFFLASRIQSLAGLYLSYGVLCGAASGFAYNSVLNIMPRWFPNNQGLISGILLMGFGASGLIIGSVFTAMTPPQPDAWRASFLFMGILIAAVLFICAFFFKPPKVNEVPAPAAGRGPGAAAGNAYTPAQMLRQPSFWLFWVWGVLLCGVGLAIIAQARPIAVMIGTDISAGAISLIVGLISVCNGLGRILMGGLFDRLGHKATMRTINILFIVGALVLITALQTQAFPLIVVGFLMVGIAYGGCPTMSAAFTRSFFGQRDYPVNLSVMNINLLVASFFGTIAGVLYDASGSYMTTFIVLTVCAVLAFVLQPFIKEPKKEAEKNAAEPIHP